MSVDLAQLDWFKSSYSGSSGGECVEVASSWQKSSYSGDNGGDCVEVGMCPGTVHVRDSKDPEGPALSFTPEAWTAFVGWAGEATTATGR
ncbi:DUF397 domain-containing protein [Actinacidiphila acidipaludis]|uniref:DUF397 domain-containing protein n=1 Tax=Actinacidiphila acidipaludis TaxID=2873382 RepID=A0ABS7QBR1_9ACTN|nr:DUF397 domain-containing protein [Streptomyces acidipaludis]MBY8880542.1 DUF397 domain-containing protein [Streptomyces acidipaludis]